MKLHRALLLVLTLLSACAAGGSTPIAPGGPSVAEVNGSGALLIQFAGNYDAFWPVMVVVGISATAMNWLARPPAQAMA